MIKLNSLHINKFLVNKVCLTAIELLKILKVGYLMKPEYNRTDFPNGRSHILMRDLEFSNPELVHFVLVLTKKGTLWVDVFWPYDEEAEEHTYKISEQQFWQTFREWRLQGVILGDSSKVAELLAQKRLSKNQRTSEDKSKKF